MGAGQELTNGLKGVGHVFSFMLKQKKNPPTPQINKVNGAYMVLFPGKCC